MFLVKILVNEQAMDFGLWALGSKELYNKETATFCVAVKIFAVIYPCFINLEP